MFASNTPLNVYFHNTNFSKIMIKSKNLPITGVGTSKQIASYKGYIYLQSWRRSSKACPLMWTWARGRGWWSPARRPGGIPGPASPGSRMAGSTLYPREGGNAPNKNVNSVQESFRLIRFPLFLVTRDNFHESRTIVQRNGEVLVKVLANQY